MDVAQSSSSFEAETSEEETVDEDTLLRSPLEQKIETGTAPSCSAEVSTGGVATGQKRKTEGGPSHTNVKGRPEKYSLQLTMERRQRQCIPNRRWQAVPRTCRSHWEGTVTEC